MFLREDLQLGLIEIRYYICNCICVKVAAQLVSSSAVLVWCLSLRSLTCGNYLWLAAMNRLRESWNHDKLEKNDEGPPRVGIRNCLVSNISGHLDEQTLL